MNKEIERANRLERVRLKVASILTQMYLNDTPTIEVNKHNTKVFTVSVVTRDFNSAWVEAIRNVITVEEFPELSLIYWAALPGDSKNIILRLTFRSEGDSNA